SWNCWAYCLHTQYAFHEPRCFWRKQQPHVWLPEPRRYCQLFSVLRRPYVLSLWRAFAFQFPVDAAETLFFVVPEISQQFFLLCYRLSIKKRTMHLPLLYFS